MPSQHADRRRAIESALLDFHRAPGRHAPALRQPALLFAAIRDVLQIAAGRGSDEGSAAPAPTVVHAARFFVAGALLRPEANHYALLGLAQTANAAAIKERYRLLMRLTHPDFAPNTANACWPADAATRINLAYEVLSSPERRRAYDENIAPAPKAVPPAAPKAHAQAAPRRAPMPRGVASRHILPRLAAGFGTLGGLALVGFWVSGAQGDRDTLVQRATTKIDRFPALFAPAARATPAEPVTAATAVVMLPAMGRPLPEIAPAVAPAMAPTPEPALPVAAASTEPPAAPPATVAAVSPPSAPAPAVAPSPAPESGPRLATPPGPTMAAVQQPLTQLLQEIESGWGDNLIAMLDTRARRTLAAQAVARELDALCDGVRPVKIAKVDFKSEPRDGRLLVNGVVTLQVRGAGAPTRQLALQAEFAAQGGTPVLTRLAPLGSP